MIILKEFIWVEDHYVYHLTQKNNLDNIIKCGLIPMCQERSISHDDAFPAIYFFDNLDNLFNWIYALYKKDDLNGLELLRFNLKRKQWFLHNGGEDFYLQEKIKPNELMYLSNSNELIDEEDLGKKLIWTPIKDYNK